MKAYTSTITKEEFVIELKKHQKADNFVRGHYFEDGKGCAVGCSLESISRIKHLGIKDFSNHKLYETHLGIPEWLALIEDRLFEGISKDRASSWPVEFAESIKTGVDLDQIKTAFTIVILERSILSMDSVVYDKTKFKEIEKVILQSREAVQLMIKAHQGQDDWSAAESAAWSAAFAARSAAFAARSAAESAARSAARSAAESAAFAARSAAESAARSAAESAAWSATYDYFADELLKLLKEAI